MWRGLAILSILLAVLAAAIVGCGGSTNRVTEMSKDSAGKGAAAAAGSGRGRR